MPSMQLPQEDEVRSKYSAECAKLEDFVTGLAGASFVTIAPCHATVAEDILDYCEGEQEHGGKRMGWGGGVGGMGR